ELVAAAAPQAGVGEAEAEVPEFLAIEAAEDPFDDRDDGGDDVAAADDAGGDPGVARHHGVAAAEAGGPGCRDHRVPVQGIQSDGGVAGGALQIAAEGVVEYGGEHPAAGAGPFREGEGAGHGDAVPGADVSAAVGR